MANFVDVPVLSKLKIGTQTYYLKDAEVRALIPTLESGIAANAADIDLLEVNKQDVVAFADGYDAESNKAATVKTVTDAVKDITSFEFEIVNELPSTGKKGVIYLKKHTESGVDMYEEFIWVNNRFEKIGDTRIDLSNYYTKTEVDGLIDGVEALVEAEETRAKEAEEDLADDLADEVERATAAEAANTAAITAEASRADAAEKVNAAAIAAEETRAKGVEDGLADDIAAEETRATGVEDELAEDIAALESSKADKDALGALAYKDSASGTVEGQTISGVKATGTSTGELTGALGYTSTSLASSGTYKPEGTVGITGSAIASATLANNTAVTVKSMATAGQVASFTEGSFTPASLTHAEASFAKAGVVAHVGTSAASEDTECLYFEDAQTANASLISAFDGGSKAADSFTANVLPTFEDKSLMPATATISTTAADLDAEFTGTSKAVEVSGNYDKANLGTVAFEGKSIELNVGTITVAQKNVTVE